MDCLQLSLFRHFLAFSLLNGIRFRYQLLIWFVKEWLQQTRVLFLWFLYLSYWSLLFWCRSPSFTNKGLAMGLWSRLPMLAMLLHQMIRISSLQTILPSLLLMPHHWHHRTLPRLSHLEARVWKLHRPCPQFSLDRTILPSCPLHGEQQPRLQCTKGSPLKKERSMQNESGDNVCWKPPAFDNVVEEWEGEHRIAAQSNIASNWFSS